MTADNRFYVALSDDDPAELYEDAPCAYLSTSPDGTIVKVNRTFLAWTGHQRDDIVGRRRIQDLLGRGDQIFFETHLRPALMMQGQVREIAVELVTVDGAHLPVLLNSVLVRSDDGEPRIVRTVIFDARERRAYERELVAARERAEASEARVRALARTLQESVLPPAIPDVPGLAIAGRYRPAGDGSEVGGDFYDVFETGDGRWAIVLGDIAGKGASAAALTAVARHTVRAEATRSATPSDVLRGVHRAVLRHDGDRFCTALYVLIEPGSASHRLTVASGGHLLPLHVDAKGVVRSAGHIGSILGVLEEIDVTDAVVELGDGDALVLFTDGVTEASSGGEFFDEARLRSLLEGTAGRAAHEIADTIVDDVLAFQGGYARDDIAVVVVARP